MFLKAMSVVALGVLILLTVINYGKAHDGYPWRCCSGTDCAPATYGPVVIQEGPHRGWWEVHTSQARMLFKPDTVLETFRVNGRVMPGVHACFYQYVKPPKKGYRLGRCLHIGGGA